MVRMEADPQAICSGGPKSDLEAKGKYIETSDMCNASDVFIEALKGTPLAKHRERPFINCCFHLRSSLWLKRSD